MYGGVQGKPAERERERGRGAITAVSGYQA